MQPRQQYFQEEQDAATQRSELKKEARVATGGFANRPTADQEEAPKDEEKALDDRQENGGESKQIACLPTPAKCSQL